MYWIIGFVLIISGLFYFDVIPTDLFAVLPEGCVSNEPTTVEGYKDEICSWVYNGVENEWKSFICKYSIGGTMDFNGETRYIQNHLDVEFGAHKDDSLIGCGIVRVDITDFPHSVIDLNTNELVTYNNCNEFLTNEDDFKFCTENNLLVDISVAEPLPPVPGMVEPLCEDLNVVVNEIKNKYFDTFISCEDVPIIKECESEFDCEYNEICVSDLDLNKRCETLTCPEGQGIVRHQCVEIECDLDSECPEPSKSWLVSECSEFRCTENTKPCTSDTDCRWIDERCILEGESGFCVANCRFQSISPQGGDCIHFTPTLLLNPLMWFNPWIGLPMILLIGGTIFFFFTNRGKNYRRKILR